MDRRPAAGQPLDPLGPGADAWSGALGGRAGQRCQCSHCGETFRSPWYEQFCQRCARAMTRVLTRGM